MSLLDYSYDSSGEAFGDGLDSGADGLSGDSAFSDFSQDTLQGSSIDLAGADTWGSVTDPLSLEDQFNLSGVSDPAPDPFADLSSSWGDPGDWNGAGSAASTHPLDAGSSFDATSLFSGVAKFGSSIGQLFFKGGASTSPTLAGPVANANPNKSLFSGVSTSHAALLVGVIVVIGAAIAMGGRS